MRATAPRMASMTSAALVAPQVALATIVVGSMRTTTAASGTTTWVGQPVIRSGTRDVLREPCKTYS
jgi:hypothetical protein